MRTITKVLPKKDDHAVPAIVELDDKAILAVAGGINPQPVPPSKAARLD